MTENKKKICSFCKQTEDDVATLIQGPNVWICNSCVEQCMVILKESPDYYPIPDKTVQIALPKSNTTIGHLRSLLSKHHYDTKVELRLE